VHIVSLVHTVQPLINVERHCADVPIPFIQKPFLQIHKDPFILKFEVSSQTVQKVVFVHVKQPERAHDSQVAVKLPEVET
jgi:hypothetical protein